MRLNGPCLLRHPPRLTKSLDLCAAFAAALLSLGGTAAAQSVDLVQAFQRYEDAKTQHRVADALAAGDRAVQLRAADGGDSLELAGMLQDLGDYAIEARQDARGQGYYERALQLREASLGATHPDLVPLLDALADLHARAGRYAQASALLQRVLQIQRATYGEHHPCVLATLGRLREVHLAAHDAEAAAHDDNQIRLASAARRALITVNGKPAVRSDRYRFNKDGYTTVRVFYGTNRAPIGEATLAPYYANSDGELRYGYVNVTIPQLHQLAELESPGAWVDYSFGIDSAENKKKYIVLEKVVTLSEQDFAHELREQIGAAPSRDVLIFVHGYNNSFEDAARRTAQLAYDMDFDGTPIMYAWPSQARLTAYAADEGATDVSALRMLQFLQTVVMQSGAARVHLIAHSMGSRVLIGALTRFLQANAAATAAATGQARFGQVVFTAPDVDRAYFVAAAESLRGRAERLTLYASDSDYALRMSKLVHDAPRAGAAGNTVIRMAGLDTIDMSGISADVLGHNYFATNGGAVYDLLHMIWRDDDPGSPQRCGKRAQADVPVLWRFDFDKCKGDVMLEAAVLLKQFHDVATSQIMAQLKTQIATFGDPADQKEGQMLLRDVSQLLGNPVTPGAAP